jgi:hypothetical protein
VRAEPETRMYCYSHICKHGKGTCLNPRFRLPSGELDVYCRACLHYCEIEICSNLHARGTPRCLTHACICYGGTQRRSYCGCLSEIIEKNKRNWNCLGLLCKTCLVPERFLTLYLMVAMNCDVRIPNALHHTMYYRP